MEFNAIQLIRVVRDHPSLYDASRTDFKLPAKKNTLWRKIALKLKVDEEECRKRWRTLRERYTRELKRLRSTKGDGELTEEDMKSVEWGFFDEMAFLHDHVRLRKHRFSFQVPNKTGNQRNHLKVEKKSDAEMEEDDHQQHNDEGVDDGDDNPAYPSNVPKTEKIGESPDGPTVQMEVEAQPHRQHQDHHQIVTGGQQQHQQQPHQQLVYDGHHLVEDDYKEYTQLQTLDSNNATSGGMTAKGKAMTTAPTSGTSASTTTIAHHHGALAGQAYIIINNSEEPDVLMEQAEEDEHGTEDDEEEVVEEEADEAESSGEVTHQHLEYLVPEAQSSSHQPQDQHHQHHVSLQHPNKSKQRLILTAPRDDSPSPPPLIEIQQNQQQHYHRSAATAAIVPHTNVSPYRRRADAGAGGTTKAQRTSHTPKTQQQHHHSNDSTAASCDEHEMFGQAVAASLRQLKRLHTIKAKVEIYRVLEKFVEMEEGK